MDESQERSQTLCEYRTLSPALWCVLFLFLTFALPGEKITAFMEFGQVWCGVSGGGGGEWFFWTLKWERWIPEFPRDAGEKA